MLNIILLQLMVTVVASVIACFLGGMHAFLSLLIGGLSCVVPNALFALRLYADAKKSAASPISLFLGEFIKIILTIALLGAAVRLYHDLNWLALIVGIIVALKSYILLLFRHLNDN